MSLSVSASRRDRQSAGLPFPRPHPRFGKTTLPQMSRLVRSGYLVLMRAEFRKLDDDSQRRRREKLIFASEIAGAKNGLEGEAGRMGMKPTSPALPPRAECPL